MDEAKAVDAAQRVADATRSDVLLYNGDIHPDAAKRLMDVVCPRRRAERLTMILTTPGGDPDAAFKIGRALQNTYQHITIVVPGWCKSAGTLVAIAAHELVVGDRGELGPLDIQIAKADEIMELGSGLAVDAALKTLETTASKMFLNLMLSIRRDTQGMITTRTAAELSAKMVIGLLEPIYHQVDPIKIGENSRAMNITKMYGARLNVGSNNLRSPQSLEWLVGLYPDHSFVVDRTEAKLLFTRVSEPNPLLVVLLEALGEVALAPSNQLAKDAPYIRYLSKEIADEKRSARDAAAPKPAGTKRSGRAVQRARTNGSAASDHGG